MDVGFVGLGRMGSRMAGHVLRKGHRVTGFDIDAGAGKPLDGGGLVRAEALTALGARARFVVLSLPGPAEVDAAIFGPHALAGAIAPGTTIIDTSTVGARQSREIAARLLPSGVHYLDCPVSGGVEGAERGTLSAMIGGDESAFESARPIIECFAAELNYMGPSGAGAGMKLVIQLIYMSQLVAFFEGLALSDRLGIDIARSLAIIKGSSANHPTIEKRFDKIIAGDTTPRFSISSVLKDVSLAQEELAGLGGKPAISHAAIEVLRAAIDRGCGDLDAVVLRTVLRDG